MLIRLSFHFLFALSLLGNAVHLSAEIRPAEGSVDYESLFATSDCVITGTVIGTNARESTDATALVHPDRIYKGPCDGNYVSVAYRGAADPTRAELYKGETLLMFLRRLNSKTFSQTRLGTSFVHDVSRLQASSGTGRDLLISDLLAGLHDTEKARIITSLQVLNGFASLPASALDSLKPFWDSPDSEQQLLAIAVAFSIDPRAALTKVVDIAQSSPNTMTNGASGVFALAWRIEKIQDTKLAGHLSVLTRSSIPVAIRYAALDAIRTTRDEKAVPTLIALLDDNDLQIVSLSAAALADIVGLDRTEFYPGAAAFEQQPRKFVTAWKSWWTEQGQSRYSNH